MDFDRTVELETEQGEPLTYGIVDGGSPVVFIKSGLGGSARGYEDKYVRMARMLNARYGSLVITSSNPMTGADAYLTDHQIIKRCKAENGIDDAEVYCFGASDGGKRVLLLASLGAEYTRIMTVNTPIMFDTHKLKAYMEAVSDRRLIAVYGENDPSFKYTPLLKTYGINDISLFKVSGADHQFVGMLKEYISLPVLLFDEFSGGGQY